MTAINVLLNPHAAHVLTDGAGYAPDGVLMNQAQKVFPLAHLGLIMAGRGPLFYAAALAREIGECSLGYDDALDRMPDNLKHLDALCVEHGSPEIEVVLAGWSPDRNQAEAHVIFNHGRHGPAPYHLTQVTAAFVTPMDAELFARLEEIGINLQDDAIDPETAGLRLLQEQRARSWPLPGHPDPVHVVGCFAQLTTVTASGITTRVLERWSDQIGERIAA